MNKENMLYIHSEVLIIKKNEIMSFAEKWIELETIRLSEISPSQKAKYHVSSHMGKVDA
jgi:hypothetical protein